MGTSSSKRRSKNSAEARKFTPHPPTNHDKRPPPRHLPDTEESDDDEAESTEKPRFKPRAPSTAKPKNNDSSAKPKRFTPRPPSNPKSAPRPPPSAPTSHRRSSSYSDERRRGDRRNRRRSYSSDEYSSDSSESDSYESRRRNRGGGRGEHGRSDRRRRDSRSRRDSRPRRDERSRREDRSRREERPRRRHEESPIKFAPKPPQHSKAQETRERDALITTVDTHASERLTEEDDTTTIGVLTEEQKASLTDPWSNISMRLRQMFMGESDGKLRCLHCHRRIALRTPDDLLITCTRCNEVTSTLMAQSVTGKPGAYIWKRFVDYKGVIRWKRVFSFAEEVAVRERKADLLKSTEKELYVLLKSFKADQTHYNAIDDKASLVAMLLTFRVWKAGAEIDEGFVYNVGTDGTSTWCPVGLFFCNTREAVPQLEITGQEVLSTSAKPLAFRIEWFKGKCDRLRIQDKNGDGKLHIRLRREHILEDSSNCFMAMKNSHLRRAAKYEFVGEPAMDSGGVTREWFNEVSNLIFGGPFGLFVYSANAGGCYSINPNSALASDLHLQYFRFAGRFLGKALFENCTVVGRLDTVLYKHLLQLPVTGSDVELVDPQVWRSIQMIKECEDVEMLCLTFTHADESFGGQKTVDLKPGGADIDVTNANVQEYIKLLLEHILVGNIREQLSALVHGFHEVIPKVLLSVFAPEEFDMLMCGRQEVDVEDWEKFTVYRGVYKEQGEKHPVMQWFWSLVEAMDGKERSMLLQFTTGTPNVPVQGFEGLEQGGDGNLLFNIESIDKSMSIFPRAHTCFNRLEMPLYDSKEEMERFLTEAMKIQSGFNLE